MAIEPFIYLNLNIINISIPLKYCHLSLTVNIFFSDKPNVSMNLARGLDLSNIKQENDIVLECFVDANPPPYKIIWLHNVS